MQNSIKILFFGDITGRLGRNAVKSYLANNKADFVIANIENASHGFGLTKKNYLDLSESINCFTSGNHIWDKKDVYEYINEAQNLVRPINYPNGTPGKGSAVFEIEGHKIAVINSLGRVFMPPIDSPWQVVVEEIEKLKNEGVESIFIDFHAEATAEKICFSKYLANTYNTEEHALIKGFFGTHTHVQTADEHILNGMAYITDAGFCGASDSVIGMEFATSLKRLSTSLPERYEIAQSSTAQINGVEVLIDRTRATQIKRINLIVDNNNESEVPIGNSSGTEG
ncbi:MAG: YmdB family metallophosphoesterase [Candidatus Gastranaerophilales bacterium]|nr:YmdB family metallophosphoesterase [Candidatus Gastranaerophilales bacterium]MCM1073896.1 YmdB family metallophosphoesterase [Bacteroides sp.]